MVIREVEHEGLILRVHDAGPADGDVVVLLHGFPQDAGCWDPIVPHLHRAGLRTLALEQRGYSPTARPNDVSAYRLETLAADVLAVLDACGAERAHVVGHDWGGALAWHLGAHHADRVRSLTVLSTPHPRAMARAMVGSLQPLRSWYTLAIQVPVVPELVLSQTLAPTLQLSGLPADTARRYAARLSTPSQLRGPLAWYRAVAWRPPWQLLAGLFDPGTIRVPTSYLWGNRDPALGRAAAEGTARHVTGDYLFIEIDAGHWLPENHSDQVVETIIDRVEHA